MLHAKSYQIARYKTRGSYSHFSRPEGTRWKCLRRLLSQFCSAPTCVASAASCHDWTIWWLLLSRMIASSPQMQSQLSACGSTPSRGRTFDTWVRHQTRLLLCGMLSAGSATASRHTICISGGACVMHSGQWSSTSSGRVVGSRTELSCACVRICACRRHCSWHRDLQNRCMGRTRLGESSCVATGSFGARVRPCGPR